MKVKYNQGGELAAVDGIDPTKLSPQALSKYTKQLEAELNAAHSSRYASEEQKQSDINSITRRLEAAKAAGPKKPTVKSLLSKLSRAAGEA